MSKLPKTETAPDDSDDILEVVAQQLYESICELHQNLVIGIGEERAKDIVVNALSVNLGHVLGQLSLKDQRKYATKTRQMIREHTLLGTMEKDRHVYGQVGRG